MRKSYPVLIKRMRVLTCVLALVLSLSLIVPFLVDTLSKRVHSEGSAVPESIRVGSMNTESWGDPKTIADLESSVATIGDFILDNGLEVIGLQEVMWFWEDYGTTGSNLHLQDALQMLTKYLADNSGVTWYSKGFQILDDTYYQAMAGYENWTDAYYHYGNATISKYPIVNAHNVAVPNQNITSNGYSVVKDTDYFEISYVNQERWLTKCVINDTPIGAYNFYNTHLDTSFRTFHPSFLDVKGDALETIVSQMTAQGGEGVVVGDFNCSTSFQEEYFLPSQFVSAFSSYDDVQTYLGDGASDSDDSKEIRCIDNIKANSSKYTVMNVNVAESFSDHKFIYADILDSPTTYNEKSPLNLGDDVVIRITDSAFALSDLNNSVFFDTNNNLSLNQRWIINRSSNNVYTLKNQVTGKYLSVSRTGGESIVTTVETCDTSSEKFYIYNVSGTYILRSLAETNLVLGNSSGSAQAQVYVPSSQYFSIEEMGALETNSSRLNNQFAVPERDSDGNIIGYQNMTDINQMAIGETVYVIIVSDYEEYSNNAYTQTKDFLSYEGKGNTCKFVSLRADITNHEKFIWKITKTDKETFRISPKSDLSLSVGYEDKSNGAPIKALTNNDEDVRQDWIIRKVAYDKDGNASSGDSLYSIMLKDYDTGAGNNTVFMFDRNITYAAANNDTLYNREAETSIIWYRENKDYIWPKDRFLIFPILQNSDPTATYGYSGASSYVPVPERDGTVKNITSVVSSLGNTKPNENIKKWGTSHWSMTSAPMVLPGTDSSAVQLMDISFDSDSFLSQYYCKENENYLIVENLNVWENQGVLSVKEGENNYSIGAMPHISKFWTIYSSNQNGGYLITPISYYWTVEGGYNTSLVPFHYDRPQSIQVYNFRVMNVYNYNIIDPNYNDGSVRFKSYDYTNTDQHFWIEGSGKPVNITVDDFIVDESGNIVENKDLLHTQTTESYWVGSALPTFEPANHTGYTFEGYSDNYNSGIVTNATSYCYRKYSPKTYTINFKVGSSGAEGTMESQPFVYGEPLALNENLFTFKKPVTLNTQGGTSLDQFYYEYEFKGWSTTNGGSSSISDKEVITLKSGEAPFADVNFDSVTSIDLYPEFIDPKNGVLLPISTSKVGYALYGWSTAPNSINMVENNTLTSYNAGPFYALWAGADLSTVKDQEKETYTVSANIYGNTTTPISTATGVNFDYKWERVSPTETILRGSTNSYTVSADDRGYAIKVSIYKDGVFLDSAYSKFIPSDVIVDAFPETTHEEYSEVALPSITMDSGKTQGYHVSTDKVISGVSVPSGATVKVYGMIGNSRILLMSEGETVMDQDIGISMEGVAFEKYYVEVETTASVNISNIKLLVLPRVYKHYVGSLYTKTTTVPCIVELLTGSNRAVDKAENTYFYEGDELRFKITIAADEKIVAGSYVLVDGKKVAPAYSNSESGVIYIESQNDTDVLIEKITAENATKIIAKAETTKFEACISKTSNSSNIKHNVNIGGFDVEDIDSKLRFTTMWYLDDVATSNSWYRGNQESYGTNNGFGTYIVRLSKVLASTHDNDFYDYLTNVLGITDITQYQNLTTAKSRYELVGYLESFIIYWNETNTKFKNVNATESIEKMSFGKDPDTGKDVVIDVISYNYYLGIDGTKRIVQYSASLDIPNLKQDEPLVYIPYASYTYQWDNGYFTPKKVNPENVYVYGAPSQMYTLTASKADLTIPDIEIAVGGTLPVEYMYSNGEIGIHYTYDSATYNNALSFENGNVVVAQNASPTTITVTATSLLGHKTTFKVKVVEIPQINISDVDVFIGTNGNTYAYPAEKLVITVDGYNTNEELVYSYASDKLELDTEALTVKGLVVGEHTVSYSYKGAQAGSFIVKCTAVDMNTYRFNIDSHSQSGFNNLKTNWNNNVLENKTTLFIGGSFFDPENWHTFTGYYHYQFDDAYLSGVKFSTTYNWEKFLIDNASSLKEPKNIVINIGTTNICRNDSNAGDTSEEASLGIKRLLSVLHEKFPNAKIYWFEISPRNAGQQAEKNSIINETNEIVSTWCLDSGFATALKTTVKLGEATAPFEAGNTLPACPDNKNQKDGDSYYIFTEALAYSDIKILSKDITTTTSQQNYPQNETYKHTGVILKNRYVISGKIKITSLNAESAIQFALYQGAVTNKDRFMLWAYNSGNPNPYANKAYDLCFENETGKTWSFTNVKDPETGENYSGTRLDYKYQTDPYYYWMIVVTEDDAYFYGKTDADAEYDLEAVFCKIGTNCSDENRLIISSNNVASTISDIQVITAKYDSIEYNEIVDSISNDISAFGEKPYSKHYYNG